MENEQVIDGVTYLVTYVKKEDNQKKQSKRGDGIWFINTDGDILRDKDEATDKLKPFCYPTEKEATKERDKILALRRIKEYAEEKWGEFIPDWDNHSQLKYNIVYDYEENKYIYDTSCFTKRIMPFFLEKDKHCVEIIEKFKDDLDILFDKTGK